ncbi:synaptopodin [Platysternon megacephalum]|uniref:Synaptopodin n=1 Tax=Platysternon megacephalum TaxID=55544 RepID=A0A4D9EPM0_9SAUR|nr:synaptopodin [Platysternon megacephalum]
MLRKPPQLLARCQWGHPAAPSRHGGFMVLQSEVENSLVRFLKMRQSLTSLQALEGSRELENIFGVSDSSCNLKAEVQKTKVLMAQAEKRKLLKRSNAKHPARAATVKQMYRPICATETSPCQLSSSLDDIFRPESEFIV